MSLIKGLFTIRFFRIRRADLPALGATSTRVVAFFFLICFFNLFLVCRRR